MDGPDKFSFEAMTAEAARRIAAYRASGGGESRHLEETATAELALTGRPLFLLGAAARIAAPFVRLALDRFDVRGLVDNPWRGRPIPAVPAGPAAIDDAAFLAEVAGLPGALAVICAVNPESDAHFRALAGRARVPVLQLFAAARRIGPASCLDASPWAAFADPAAAVRLLPAIQALAPRLADDASRETLAALLLHRLGFDPVWLGPISRPGGDVYFGDPGVAPGTDEVLIDGGAFTGDTLMQFARVTGGRWRHVHAFEPDPAHLGRLRAVAARYADVTVHEAALWSATTQVRFAAAGNPGSSVAPTGDAAVVAVALDDLGIDPLTLIKLDVEGAEAEALRGAAATISNRGPKLAVAAYHKPVDVVGLAEQVFDLRADYALRLRHYGSTLFDTILYAR